MFVYIGLCLIQQPNIFSNFTFSIFNALTANYEYFQSNTENLPLPIEMQLFQKPKTFVNFLLHF